MAKKQYIGDRQIRLTEKLDETTPSGVPLIRVHYMSDESEVLSELMYKHLLSDRQTSKADLMENRVAKVVELTLGICGDWGLKIGETPRFGQMLNQSLNFAVDQAELQLWRGWDGGANERDDITLVTVDRVLRSIRPTLKDITEDAGNQG